MIKYLSAHSGSPGTNHFSFTEEHRDIPWGQQTVYWIRVERDSTPRDSERQPPCYLSGVGENVLRRQTQMPAELRNQLMDLDRYNSEFAALQRQRDFRATRPLMGSLPDSVSTEERERIRMTSTRSTADPMRSPCSIDGIPCVYSDGSATWHRRWAVFLAYASSSPLGSSS